MGEALFGLLLSLGLSVLFGVEAKRPNIVFIVADDLGKFSFVHLYHHLTCWSQTNFRIHCVTELKNIIHNPIRLWQPLSAIIS